MMRQRIRPLFQRVVTLTLSAVLLLQPALAAGQPTPPHGWRSPFSDVSEEHWFYPYVAALSSQGIIAGYENGQFGPNDTTSTGAALVMLLKAADCGTHEPQAGAHWASGYAAFVVRSGWLTQTDVAQLDGEMPRLLIAQLAAQAVGLPPSDNPSPFADVTDEYVTAMYEKGLVAGTQEGDTLLFHPEASITRAEISTIAWQVQVNYNRIYFGTHILNVSPTVPANTHNDQAFLLDGDRMTYTQTGMDTAIGIDVSYYQGEIDWEKVANDDITFAMIRAGGRYYQGGTLFEDTQFTQNLQGALDAGLEVGVYFFSQAISAQEAEEEAKFILDLLEDSDFDGPVVFDWENIDHDTARTDGVDSATVTAAANAFCTQVEQAGYQPMIYFNRYIAYLCYELDGVSQYPFWLAEYGVAPYFYYDFQMWQYTDSGQVDGINGPVDMNIRILPQT